MTNYSKDEVEQILAENKKLKTEVKKYQKREKIEKREFSEFIKNELNLDLFKNELLDSKTGWLAKFKNGGGNLRYFTKRTNRITKKPEQIIKLNLFVQDLIQAKVLLNKNLKESEHKPRASMDIDSLIKHLNKHRDSRPKKGISEPNIYTTGPEPPAPYKKNAEKRKH